MHYALTIVHRRLCAYKLKIRSNPQITNFENSSSERSKKRYARECINLLMVGGSLEVIAGLPTNSYTSLFKADC